MAHATEQSTTWTAADLVDRFGPIPISRIVRLPESGTATEQDLIELHDRKPLCELIDGLLVEKTMGSYESMLAVLLASYLLEYVSPRDFGVVLGADGLWRLSPGHVRSPDAAFISWERIGGRKFPRDSITNLAPDLAAEVISAGNTRREMDRKLQDYFAAGVRLVWYVYPVEREVHVFEAPDRRTVLGSHETLTGGDMLPGISLPLARLFEV